MMIEGGGEMYRGVFWIIEGTLYAFPFKERMQSNEIGIAKSGLTYNHKNLWPKVKPKGLVLCQKIIQLLSERKG